MSADENRDNVPSLLIAEQCVSAVNEYLDGLPEEERIKNGNFFSLNRTKGTKYFV